MEQYELIQWTFALLTLVWVFTLGAVVGSFLNVLAYRMPLGLDIVRPPSACPACGTKLAWKDNIPVLGWLALGGKCRYCRTPISAQYPLVEFVTGLLFALPFALWFMEPSIAEAIGVNTHLWTPEWAANNFWGAVWPYFFAILALVGTLTAITLIDAKTFMIPLSLPVFASIVGLCAHTGMGLWHQLAGISLRTTEGYSWVIPLPEGPLLGATIGCTIGLCFANSLLQLGLIKHSFHDYDEWEKTALADTEDEIKAPDEEPDEKLSIGSLLVRTLALTGPCLALMMIGFSVGNSLGFATQGIAIGAGLGLVVGIFLRRAIASPISDDEPIWTHYPNTTREMLRELAFLAPAIALAGAGFWLTMQGGPLAHTVTDPPLWLHAASGSVFGYIIGGGLIWGLRIFGSLAMGREAMGLGDVHLLACVGAVVGWIDPTIAFFVAPFIAIAWFILSGFFASIFNRKGTAIPFGPHLAAASVFIIYAKPLIETMLSLILRERVDLP